MDSPPLISCLLPVRGRHDQTLALIPRLKATAQMGGWELLVIADADPALGEQIAIAYPWVRVLHTPERYGYWRCLALATRQAAGQFLVSLANDLLPGNAWLARAYAAHRARFAEDGLMGFSDGVHSGRHAAHMLINRSLLERWYGAALWPVCYDHLYGDQELSERAQDEGIFAVAPWAVLFHNHPVTGGQTDRHYAEAHRQQERDKALFLERKAAGWPPL